MAEISKREMLMRSRVLRCLEDLSSKSLQEITDDYNRRYPPTIFLRIIGAKKKPAVIRLVLEKLLEDNLVTKRILSFTDRPLVEPESFYALSQEGIQKLAERGKKKV